MAAKLQDILRKMPKAELHIHIEGSLEPGLTLTINSDDPVYFGGYINDNFTQTFDALSLGREYARGRATVLPRRFSMLRPGNPA